MSDPLIQFRPLTEADLPLLHAWLNQPHISEWWGDASSLDDVRAKYLPRIDADAVRPYLACQDSIPFAYIQSYVAVETDDGWWKGCSDRSVLGIDQFIADPSRLGRGLGTLLVSQFATLLFQDPHISRLQADPRPENVRAIRCYEKAGFTAHGLVETPDGPALIMILDRKAALLAGR